MLRETSRTELSGTTICLVGDLKNGRTVHSLVQLVTMLYDRVTFLLVAPRALALPSDVLSRCQDTTKGHRVEVCDSLPEALGRSQVAYITRVQKERFDDEEEYEALKLAYVVTPHTLTNARKDLVLLHPLPRVGEISPEVDSDPRAAYFRQVKNGMYVRMALLALLMRQ
eukprot:c14484_g1_i3.p1 GENE.c14484_g1_i3~~c14484_g1_i3.p1  ORF type:complete len:169 (+),score=28.99 c14484_g1_i3:751-1257(+)